MNFAPPKRVNSFRDFGKRPSGSFGSAPLSPVASRFRSSRSRSLLPDPGGDVQGENRPKDHALEAVGTVRQHPVHASLLEIVQFRFDPESDLAIIRNSGSLWRSRLASFILPFFGIWSYSRIRTSAARFKLHYSM